MGENRVTRGSRDTREVLEKTVETRDYTLNNDKIRRKCASTDLPQDPALAFTNIQWKNGGKCGSVKLHGDVFEQYMSALRTRYCDAAAETDDLVQVDWVKVKDDNGTIVEDKIAIEVNGGDSMQKAGTLHVYRTTDRFMFQGSKARWWFSEEAPTLVKMVLEPDEPTANIDSSITLL